MTTETFPRLVGKDLVRKSKELKRYSKSEVARQCGYVRIKKDGTVSIQLTQYQEALDIALGLRTDTKQTSKKDKDPIVSIQKTGTIVIGQLYTANFPSGAKFKITTGRKKITLDIITSEKN